MLHPVGIRASVNAAAAADDDDDDDASHFDVIVFHIEHLLLII